MAKQSIDKNKIQKHDIIDQQLFRSDDCAEMRPIWIEKIDHDRGFVAYRPITDTYHGKNEHGITIRDQKHVKDAGMTIKDWQYAGLDKESNINFGVRQVNKLSELNSLVRKRGTLSEYDQDRTIKIDNHLVDYLDNLKQNNPNTFYKYVTTHNYANQLANVEWSVDNPNSGKIIPYLEIKGQSKQKTLKQAQKEAKEKPKVVSIEQLKKLREDPSFKY